MWSDLLMQDKKFLITLKAKYFWRENLDKTLIFEPALEPAPGTAPKPAADPKVFDTTNTTKSKTKWNISLLKMCEKN